jgi:hypothetical protein
MAVTGNIIGADTHELIGFGCDDCREIVAARRCLQEPLLLHAAVCKSLCCCTPLFARAICSCSWEVWWEAWQRITLCSSAGVLRLVLHL